MIRFHKPKAHFSCVAQRMWIWEVVFHDCPQPFLSRLTQWGKDKNRPPSVPTVFETFSNPC